MFSRRTDHDPNPNDLTLAVRARRARGDLVVDLTDANPTRLQLPVLEEPLLAQPAARSYEPDAFGHEVARRSVAAEYARAGVTIDPARIVVTASTSEAYAYLFKILADPGDTVLIPAPSYPLFDFLARGEAVQTSSYPLLFDGHGHAYEAELLRHALRRHGAPPRAVIVVSPNHPTGSQVDAAFVRAAHEEGLPVIVDEVFGRFALDEPAPLTFAETPLTSGLTFRLCGLSKQLGLPQLKLSWLTVEGDPVLVEAALARLELVADTFLSVASPVQHALESLFANGPSFRRAVRERTTTNLRALRLALRGTPLSVLRAPAGWTAVVRAPDAGGDEALAIQLLEREGVLVHPGHFFGFGFESLVISLLPPTETFARGAAALARFAGTAFPL